MASAATSGHIQHVLVVGGGTAGWLTASHLAKKLRARSPDGVRVTLLESDNIPTIGVGEGTVPAIRQTLQYLGISETEFIRECDASFKQSIKFVDWVHNPVAGRSDYYHHVFDYPDTRRGDLTPYWLKQAGTGRSFVDAVSVQGLVCDRGLGPKNMTLPEYQGLTSYAYHLDAAKFARLLTRHAVEELGVRHLLGTVEQVRRSDDGDIAAVVTDRHGALEADLFVDCTGFASLLLGQSLDVPFIDRTDVLFADHALAAQVPYGQMDAPIPSYTISTAQESGWIWDIGLPERRGTGYVYSSAHTDHERAETVFRNYLGAAGENAEVRRIPMKIGYRDRFWERNCVAIGLSQGFVEPLEATGILVYDATAKMLADTFPANREVMSTVAAQFNRHVRYAWERVIEFIKLHYCISQRTDSDFWLDNRAAESIPEALREKLALWRCQPPSDYDFPSKMEIFNLPNYLYVLYGMDFVTSAAHISNRFADDDNALARFVEIEAGARQLCEQLPAHRELIRKIKQFGLQKI
ncbi:tryptophan 7-halogenase [Microbulbifer flavimaris]|uniref:Tryptophan 7-halogenase n=1 Tax=Microbulbifer flavimaris TaxID=1781068 RepID=A0ABX4HZP1_9GAMM|nr:MULTISPECIES: tryptophan halogenase family protein [Microbulbifer]KUJ83292.1 tryptophan halogenase [Microbulbifer sp. ZGT114]PCO05443.1 tryptophan 7-halogenase [Microbulbifer flavimaris]